MSAITTSDLRTTQIRVLTDAASSGHTHLGFLPSILTELIVRHLVIMRGGSDNRSGEGYLLASVTRALGVEINRVGYPPGEISLVYRVESNEPARWISPLREKIFAELRDPCLRNSEMATGVPRVDNEVAVFGFLDDFEPVEYSKFLESG